MKKMIMAVMAVMAAGMFAGAQEAAPKAKYEKLPAGGKEPVLMVGDSMMRLLGKALERDLKKEGVEAASFSSLGSGLARLDVFDWFTKIESLVKEHKPSVAVVTLGANDRQPLQDTSGKILQFGTPEWRTEYSARIGRAMDSFVSNGVDRVIWLMLPDMRDNTQQDYAMMVNGIYAEQAAMDSRKDKVVLFDVRPVVSRTPGKFTQFIMSPTGEALSVRDVDGVHLTNVGAKLVAESLIKTFWKD